MNRQRMIGSKLSEETRSRMRESQRARYVALSPEDRKAEKISLKGRKRPVEFSLKMSLAQKGRIKSEEHRAKISATLKARAAALRQERA